MAVTSGCSIGCFCCDMARPSGPAAASTPAAPTSNSPRWVANRRKLAGETVAQLNLDNPFVISSPRKRALVTAELAGLTVDEVNPLISEWDYGDYEGTTTDEIRKTVPELAGLDARLPRRRNRRGRCANAPTGRSHCALEHMETATMSCSSDTATSPAR